ncbi:hypothetical protein BT96DRAFT_994682 [Gymnopus androsaceus JB14]|uniref:Uncharacterized protein n=1 Tax=Gymnopus androsaceus JB14 TaxID=1447944 RepID=A0A6A4HIJ7_9AGAR|nr:hypothetical protein BT96DRAFT_994682 [Gymnopus androsaceus JB14]
MLPRPTIELPLDELLNGTDSPRPWSPAFFTSSSNNGNKSPTSAALLCSTIALASNNNESPVFYLPNTNNNHNEDVVMQPIPITTVSCNSFGHFGSFNSCDADDSSADVEMQLILLIKFTVCCYPIAAGAFSREGDSGAAVVDGLGRIGGTNAANKDLLDITYVTPIDFILKSMVETLENGLCELNVNLVLTA